MEDGQQNNGRNVEVESFAAGEDPLIQDRHKEEGYVMETNENGDIAGDIDNILEGNEDEEYNNGMENYYDGATNMEYNMPEDDMEEYEEYMIGHDVVNGLENMTLNQTFEESYICYSPIFIEGKSHLESGDKLIMPRSALARLASMEVDYPMLFEIHNPTISKTSHCGVLEFVADEGVVFMPQWMMQNLSLEDGDSLKIKSTFLPKATYIKLQPHTKSFLNITNVKAVLEYSLRTFTCLTVGDSIIIPYGNKTYKIDIVEAQPANAVSVIETDCEVDFATPLDYQEQERSVAPPSIAPAQASAQDEQTESKFIAFGGVGRRLDGKSCSSQGPVAEEVAASPACITRGITGAAGKLVFATNKASNQDAGHVLTKSNKDKEPAEDEAIKFKSFTGKSYSLQ